jgi:hypothetical protein
MRRRRRRHTDRVTTRRTGLAAACALLAVATACRAGGPAAARAADRAADEAALRALHRTVLTAHLEGKVEPWMATEADRIVQANNGVISYPEKAARAAGRSDYLARTRFTVYRDLRDPIVSLSADGTLGWLLAEVETKGVQRGDDGVETPVDATWAWIELYEKQAGAWRGVGNVSNRRPGGA